MKKTNQFPTKLEIKDDMDGYEIIGRNRIGQGWSFGIRFANRKDAEKLKAFAEKLMGIREGLA